MEPRIADFWGSETFFIPVTSFCIYGYLYTNIEELKVQGSGSNAYFLAEARIKPTMTGIALNK